MQQQTRQKHSKKYYKKQERKNETKSDKPIQQRVNNEQEIINILKEERQIDLLFSGIGFKRKPIPKDGACLFRSFSDLYYGTQKHHLQVRKDCVEYMREHKDFFKEFIFETDFESYLKEMLKPQSWGGELEIEALAQKFDVDITVYGTSGILTEHLAHSTKENLKNFTKINQWKSNDNVIDIVKKVTARKRKHAVLCFLHGNHYDSVYTDQEFKTMILMQDIVYESFLEPFHTDEFKKKPNTYKNVEYDHWLEELEKMELKSMQKVKDLLSSNLKTYDLNDASDFPELAKEKPPVTTTTTENNVNEQLEGDKEDGTEKVKVNSWAVKQDWSSVLTAPPPQPEEKQEEEKEVDNSVNINQQTQDGKENKSLSPNSILSGVVSHDLTVNVGANLTVDIKQPETITTSTTTNLKKGNEKKVAVNQPQTKKNDKNPPKTKATTGHKAATKETNVTSNPKENTNLNQTNEKKVNSTTSLNPNAPQFVLPVMQTRQQQQPIPPNLPPHGFPYPPQGMMPNNLPPQGFPMNFPPYGMMPPPNDGTFSPPPMMFPPHPFGMVPIPSSYPYVPPQFVNYPVNVSPVVVSSNQENSLEKDKEIKESEQQQTPVVQSAWGKPIQFTLKTQKEEISSTKVEANTNNTQQNNSITTQPKQPPTQKPQSSTKTNAKFKRNK